MRLNDRSSFTVLNNPYEIAGAWSFLDYQNSILGLNYKSCHTAAFNCNRSKKLHSSKFRRAWCLYRRK